MQRDGAAPQIAVHTSCRWGRMGGISLVFVCGNQWGPPQTRLRNLKMEVLVIRPFGVVF